MSKHAPEPWKCEGHVVYFKNRIGGFSLRDCQSPDDTARRIAACVNACVDMVDPAGEIDELKRQRDELVVENERLNKALDDAIAQIQDANDELLAWMSRIDDDVR